MKQGSTHQHSIKENRIARKASLTDRRHFLEFIDGSPGGDGPSRWRNWWIAAMACLILAGGLVRIGNLSSVVSRSPDERTYAWEGRTVQEQGMAGIRTLVQRFQQDPTLFSFPTPGRAGYILLVAKMMDITGLKDERAGAYLSAIASVLSIILLGYLGWRLFNPATGMIVMLLYAFSPIELALARRAWQDALVECLVTAMVVITLRITQGARDRIWYVLLAVLGGIGVVVKEVSVISFGLCGLWILWVLAEKKEWKESLTLAIISLVGLGIGILWVGSALGGVKIFVDFFAATLVDPRYVQYGNEYESGPAYLLLEAIWFLSPVLVIFSVFGIGQLFKRSERSVPIAAQSRREPLFLSLFVFTYIALSIFSPHRLNLRYVSAAIGPAYLLAAYGISAALFWARSKMQNADARVVVAGLFGVLLLPVIHDYGTFQSKIVEGGIPDLSVKMILDTTTYANTPAEANTRSVPKPDVSGAERAARQSPNADNYLDLSMAYYNAGRFQDCITASREALRLSPGLAAAHNNMAAAYQSISQWDSAIAEANEALRIDPHFQLAKNNLEYALSQKNIHTPSNITR